MTRARILVAVGAGLLVTMAACGGGGDAGGDGGHGGHEAGGGEGLVPIEEITLTATDESFDGLDSIPADPVTITVQNDGKQPHFTAFARLNDGVTEEKFQDVVQKKGPDALFPLITVAGSIGPTDPGDTSQASIRFTEGTYVVIDPETKGPPPFAFFDVTAPSGDEVETPPIDWHIETGDFFFQVGQAVSGPSLIHVANTGEQAHEISITKKGSKGEEGEVFQLAPVPGGELWTEVDLEPGEYTVACYFPDPKTGKPHIKLGMKQDFTVE